MGIFCQVIKLSFFQLLCQQLLCFFDCLIDLFFWFSFLLQLPSQLDSAYQYLSFALMFDNLRISLTRLHCGFVLNGINYTLRNSSLFKKSYRVPLGRGRLLMFFCMWPEVPDPLGVWSPMPLYILKEYIITSLATVARVNSDVAQLCLAPKGFAVFEFLAALCPILFLQSVADQPVRPHIQLRTVPYCPSF